MASRSSASAKTRPGTRIGPLAGSSQITSPTRRSSDIEHHPRAPAFLGPVEAEPVVGRALHEMRWIADRALNHRADAFVRQVERGQAFGHQPARLTQERQLTEP